MSKYWFYFTFLVLLLCWPVASAGQSPRVKAKILNYRRSIKKLPEGKPKIETLIRASRELRKVAPNIALGFAKQATQIAERTGQLEGFAWTALGSRYINNGNYSEAIPALKKAANYNYQDNNSSRRAKNYESLGHSYEELKQLESALENYQKFLFVSEKSKNKSYIMVAHNEIGEVYFKQKNYEKAREAFQAALDLALELGRKTDASRLKKNVAICDAQISDVDSLGLADAEIEKLEFQEKYETVKDSLEEARQMVQKISAEIRQKEGQLRQKDQEISSKSDSLTVEKEGRLLAEMESEQKKKDFEYAVLAGGATALFLLIIAGLLFRGNFIKKRANRQLSAKNEVIAVEKQKTDELLGSILPTEVVAELKAKGVVTPRKYRKVSLIFTDFRGFTQLSTAMSPEQLIRDLNYCFAAFDDICQKHGLEKIKTIGDAYMAAGGIPTANHSNPRDAINAALEMQDFIKKWGKEKQARSEEPWLLRIGIHTGPVIAGVIGKYKFAYDVWGDTVNVASRLETAGEVGKVNVSRVTYKLTENDFEFEHRGQIPIKNKGTIDMYFVEGGK